MYTGPTVGLAAQLVAGLTVGVIKNTGVADYAKALQAIFIKLIVWFKKFLALYHSAHALI